MANQRGMGGVYRRSRSSNWWIRYSVNGKKVRESARTSKKKDAVELLKKRLTDGPPITLGDEVMYGDLEDVILADYIKRGNRSLDRLEVSIKHLRRAFGNWPVASIKTKAIDRYGADRLAEGAAPASVNREYAALRRMFKLAVRAELITAESIPAFDMLPEKNVRVGFFEEAELRAMFEHLPEFLHALCWTGFYTGWRREEVRTRKWRHVDFDDGWLILEAGETKNGKGRSFPLFPEMRAVLEAQYARKLEIERSTGQIISSVFFYDDGRPIKDFRSRWNNACIAAGYWEWMTDQNGEPVLDRNGNQRKRHTKLFHDFRRTAARNLVRAGVPTVLAIQFTGHETVSVFKRYAIGDEKAKKEAVEKYAAQLRGDSGERLAQITGTVGAQ